MKRFGPVLAVLMSTSALACTVSTDEGAPVEPSVGSQESGLQTFHLDTYRMFLDQRLPLATPGGSYVVYKDGVVLASNAWGWARYGQRPWSIDTTIGMMSMGKTITAAAYTILLAQRSDLSLSSTIGPFLPHTWLRGANVNNITFRSLLRHESGFPGGTTADAYSEMKPWVMLGVAQTPSSRSYANINFTLLRVTMAYMLDRPTADAYENAGLADLYTASTFKSWVKTNLLTPLGLQYAVDTEPMGSPVAAYYGPSPVLSEEVPATDGSGMYLAGAGHWNLSVRSYARIIDALRRGLLNVGSIQIWPIMRDNLLGLDGLSRNGTTYATKNGAWSSGGAGGCARFMTYPNGITTVWVVNSVNSNSNCPVADTQSWMADLYDASFY